MRIATYIAAGGGRSTTRIPMPSAKMADCLNADGKIDCGKAARAFAGATVSGSNPFTGASDDDEHVYFACMAFLELLAEAYDEVADNPQTAVQHSAQNRQDEINRRKMDDTSEKRKRRICYVRNDVRRTADGVRVKVSVGNPHGVVGQTEQEAVGFAIACCQLWMRIKAQVAEEHGKDWISLTADDAVRAEAEEHNKAAEARREADAANGRRDGCPNRQACGYCSPCVFDCPCYAAGKCAEVDWRDVLKAKREAGK